MSVLPSTFTRVPGSLECMAILGRGVFIELIRRKEFYVLLILMMIYVIGVGIAGIVGIENEATLVFLLNLGIAFAWMSAHLLTLLTAARQIPFELENRTLHPLLAKPVSRRDYILGKWIAVWGSGLASFLVLFGLSWIPWLAYPNAPVLNAVMLVQALLSNALSLGLLAGLGLLFSLLVPQGVNVTLLGILVFFGTQALNFARAPFLNTPSEGLARWVTAYAPDFTMMNLFNRYTDGAGPVGSVQFLGLVILIALQISVTLALAGHLFQRRTL